MAPYGRAATHKRRVRVARRLIIIIFAIAAAAAACVKLVALQYPTAEHEGRAALAPPPPSAFGAKEVNAIRERPPLNDQNNHDDDRVVEEEGALSRYCDVKSPEAMLARLRDVRGVKVPHKTLGGKGVPLPLRQRRDNPQLFLQAVTVDHHKPSLKPATGAMWRPGWNCLAAWDRDERCVIAARSFVVFDSVRKATEYGVAPQALPHVWGSDVQADTHPLRQQELLLQVPQLCIRGVPCPIVVQALPHLQRLYRMTATGDAAGRPEGELQYLRLSENIELFYGRGSFWLLDDGGPNGTAADIESMRALFRRKALLAVKKRMTMQRSPFAAHYYFERHVILHPSGVAPGKIERCVVPVHPIEGGRAAFFVSSHWLSTATTTLPRISTAEAFLEFLLEMRRRVEEKKGEVTCAAVVTDSLELRVPATATSLKVEVPAGCTVLFDADVSLTVGADVTLHIGSSSNTGTGGDERRSLLTAATAGAYWTGITVEARGTLAVAGTTVAQTGSARHKRRKGTGSHIKYASPALTGVGSDSAAAAGARVFVNHSAFVNCAGPVFGAGRRAQIVIADTLFQDIAQGGECVECEALLERVHVLDVPYESGNLQRETNSATRSGGQQAHDGVYVDGDNDGLYVRGGKATLRHIVVANTLDDCVDSASSTPKRVEKADGEATHLTVDGSVLQNCLHEGIALSSGAGTFREVFVSNSIISDVQQGVENGHAAAGHRATLRGVLIRRTQVALRHGDNYPLPIESRIRVQGTIFVNNTINVLEEEFALSHAKGWFNPFIEDHTIGNRHIALINSTEWRRSARSHGVSQLGWWRLLEGEGGGRMLSVGRRDGLNPILCGRRHYDEM